jgi:hypothetical protein
VYRIAQSLPALAFILQFMFSHSYHLLEREYNQAAMLLAGPLDVDDRNQLTQRQLTIILEAREMAKIMDYPAPRWCAARK